MAQKSHHIFIAVFTDPCDTAKQVLQGWIHLRLPSCRPGFESHPHHLCFYNLLYNFWYICYVKRTKINKKRRVWSLFSKFYSTDPERERERERVRECELWYVVNFSAIRCALASSDREHIFIFCEPSQVNTVAAMEFCTTYLSTYKV